MRIANLRIRSLSSATLAVAALAGGCATAPADDASDEAEATTSSAISFGTMSLVAEHKFASIMSGPAAAHYEASGVHLHNGLLYVVFDNMSRIGKVSTNLLSGTYTTGGAETNSQYEAITFDDNNTEHFYVSAETSDHQIVQFDSAANATSATPQPTNVSFSDTNKGLEGLAWVWRNNNDYLLGLCEGFDCTSSHGGAGGRGGILVMAQTGAGWAASSTLLRLPAAVTFGDYSDLALTPNADGSYKVAVTSQESKKLWVGTLSGTSWAFIGDGTIYSLPSADYCNVEGVTFLSPTRVALVSDWNNDGPSSCSNKDQMIHVFDLL